MKHLLLTLTFLSSCSDPSILVIDGDTIEYQSTRIRLQGFNAPESSNPKCIREKRLANQSTERLRALISSYPTQVIINKGTCGYGRKCGTLLIDGVDVGDILIQEGLAEPYRCSGTVCPRPRSWCHV